MSKNKTIKLIRSPYSVVYGVFGRLPRHREIRPPLGLLYLAGALRKEGIGVEIVDGEVELLDVEAMLKRVLGSAFVGFTATTPEFNMVSEVAKRLKKLDPAVTTIIGGNHASAVPEDILRQNPWFDYIIVGEGERVLPRIIKNPPKEKIIVADVIEDIDNIPLPAKDLLEYRPYRYPAPYKGLIPMDAILTSRGCPYNCGFCFKVFRGQMRFRNIEKVIDEIEWVHRNKKVSFFMLFDDTFTLIKERVEQFCEQLRRRKLKLYFYCSTRGDTITRDLLKLMRENGFVKITMGVESGNQKILERINKKITLEQYRRAYQWMRELGIETRASFIFGLPYESEKEIRDSINFAKELDIYRASFNILTPYPGTELYEEAKRGGQGLRLVCNDWKEFKRWGSAVVETPYLKREDLMRLQKQALQEFYARPKVIWHHLRQFFRLKHHLYYYRPLFFAIKNYILQRIFRPLKK